MCENKGCYFAPVTIGEKNIEIDNGAVVYGYKLFAATGFLRGAELDVLDR